MKETLFIFNPRAGKQNIKGQLTGVLDELCRDGQPLQVYCTQKQGDGVRVAREWAGRCGKIICSGGDGTLNEVVSGILEAGGACQVGYLPCGSTNDFSVNLKLPRDLQEAAVIARGGRAFACDIGKAGSRYFVYCAAFGLFTRTSYSVAQGIKNKLGHVAYVLDGIKQLSDVTDYHMRVRHDGQVVEGDFIYGMVTNSVSVGGFSLMDPKEVLLDDGKFELCLVRRPRTLEQLNQILTGLIQTDFRDREIFYTAKVDRLQLECDGPVAWSLDGEFGGEMNSWEIEVLPRRLEILSGL